jgi:hypothetical protein
MKAVFEVEPATQDSLEEILRGLKRPTAGVAFPKIPKEQLQKWCARWKLRAPWCEEFAEQLIRTWWLQSRAGGDSYSDEALRERAVAQELAAQPFQEHRLVIDFGAWSVTQLTKIKFREECQIRFDRELNLFVDKVEQLAVDAGMERTREKREEDHFYWLARYLVKGETTAEIHRFSPKMQNSSRRAITKAIFTLAADLDLPLHPKDEDSNSN